MKHRVSCAYGAALVGIAALLAACVAPTTRRTDLVAPARPIGAASDATARSNAAAEQKQADQDVQRSADAAEGYRRALSACLEGRGYTVR